MNDLGVHLLMFLTVQTSLIHELCKSFSEVLSWEPICLITSYMVRMPPPPEILENPGNNVPPGIS